MRKLVVAMPVLDIKAPVDYERFIDEVEKRKNPFTQYSNDVFCRTRLKAFGENQPQIVPHARPEPLKIMITLDDNDRVPRDSHSASVEEQAVPANGNSDLPQGFEFVRFKTVGLLFSVIDALRLSAVRSMPTRRRSSAHFSKSASADGISVIRRKSIKSPLITRTALLLLFIPLTNRRKR